LTALSLTARADPVDTAEAGWELGLPAGVGAAMNQYLRDAVQDQQWARDLLTALAWSQGDGLDDFACWAAVATALGVAVYTERDIGRLLLDTGAADLVNRSIDGGRVAVRMFHGALAEHLRLESLRLRPQTQIHRRIVDALVDQVPLWRAGLRDWRAAAEYVRRNLSTHAAAAGRLDDLIAAPGFLAAVEPARLLAALPSATTQEGRRVARILERVGQQLLRAEPDEGTSYLEMAAWMAGDPDLAGHFGALQPDRPWRVQWARWARWTPRGCWATSTTTSTRCMWYACSTARWWLPRALGPCVPGGYTTALRYGPRSAIHTPRSLTWAPTRTVKMSSW
jgi:hypothetical protein